MKKILLGVMIFVASYQLYGQSIKDLDFLIGAWETVETIYPGLEKEYQEKGTRICGYYLNDSFIKCESSTKISTSGKERKVVYYINYDKKEECFWATTLASDFPKHGQHKWFLDEENQQIIAITPKNVIGDRFFRGTISYADKNRLIWDGWASKFSSDKNWQQIFHDVATKK